MNNNNEIKGKDYYFISYQPKILSGKVSIGFLLLFQMLEQLVLVLFIMIIIFPFFQLKVIQILCPIMIQKIKSDIYIFNKKFRNIQSIILSINVKLRSLNDASMKFTKLSSIKYNKNDKSYQIVYDFQN